MVDQAHDGHLHDRPLAPGKACQGERIYLRSIGNLAGRKLVQQAFACCNGFLPTRKVVEQPVRVSATALIH